MVCKMVYTFLSKEVTLSMQRIKNNMKEKLKMTNIRFRDWSSIFRISFDVNIPVLGLQKKFCDLLLFYKCN